MTSTHQCAQDFIDELSAQATPEEASKRAKHFAGDDPENKCLGIKMGDIFKLAKQYVQMSLEQINILLDSPYYEIRMGGVSIMDFQARKNISEDQRKALFDLYLRRHDRLNNWDFPDRAAPHVIGQYLLDKPRDVLYDLAKSDDVWERRTAILATAYFIKQGESHEAFKIAALLLDDPHDLTHKAVGSWLREAGKIDEAALRAFLDEHASEMSRTTLRYATEKLGPASKEHYRNLAS
ncbi:MAG: DNA alkylation repair protein [Deinococcota bacterium]